MFRRQIVGFVTTFFLLFGLGTGFWYFSHSLKIAPERVTVTIFSAVSLSEMIKELAVVFENEKGIHCIHSFGSSSTLARQIESGAPAQIFLSANEEWIRYLDEKELLITEAGFCFAENVLVWIAPKTSTLGLSLDDMKSNGEKIKGKIALGDPTHVPAGIYAKNTLEHFGLWEKLKNQLIPTADVRAAVITVARRDAESGFCYATDIAFSDKVKILLEIPKEASGSVRYFAALPKNATDKNAKAFLEFLKSEKAKEILTKHGFKLP